MFKLLKIHEQKIYGGIILFLLSLNWLIWFEVFDIANKPELAIFFFDVGQGDAVFIESRDGAQILVDGGPNGRILPYLGSAMPYGDNLIDVVVVSHPHADHIAGLIEVLKKYEVGAVIESGVFYDTPEAEEFQKLVFEKGVKRILVEKPSKLSFFNSVVIRFLHPYNSYAGQHVKDINETSLIATLEYAGKKILFTGDAGKATETRLLQRGVLGDVDVLKVGHQGSKYSSTNEFLNKISPEYAVISVGKNSYGHPHPDALSRLASAGAKVFRTDRDGTVKLEIRDGDLMWK